MGHLQPLAAPAGMGVGMGVMMVGGDEVVVVEHPPLPFCKMIIFRVILDSF